MKKQSRNNINSDNIKLKRKHAVSLLLNDYELQAFNKYCSRYKVKNKAKFMRETIVSAILKKFDTDYPSLFDPQNLPEEKKVSE